MVGGRRGLLQEVVVVPGLLVLPGRGFAPLGRGVIG